uniref:Uncharacterized protein n=1 Tax=Arundo donax TaxID=35708 RepID=A0A0A9H235_ARUDO
MDIAWSYLPSFTCAMPLESRKSKLMDFDDFEILVANNV